MLNTIHIEHFAIVDSLSLEFYPRLNILTGETGAGKSIWVDAVSLALGQRAESYVIREGKARCAITLCFDIRNNASAQTWLAKQDLQADEECVIRRVITREGPSRATINGTPCPLQLIRELAALLINIHSQHQSQLLLKSEAQQNCLDHYANHHTLLEQTQNYYHQWRALEVELKSLHSKANHRDQELALLRYQLEELEQLALGEQEWETLYQQHQQLHQAKHLLVNVNAALNDTTEDDINALSLTQQAIAQLTRMNSDQPYIQTASELLQTAAIHLQEASNELNAYRHQLDLSPEYLATIEQRLTNIHDLARKHHVEPEQLHEVKQSLLQKIALLEDIEENLARIQTQQQNIATQYERVALQLTKSRENTAKQLSQAITQSMQSLGMEGGQFHVALMAEKESIHPLGNERIQFQVATNPGQSLQPLNKIVSGGELSRLSLALQVLTAQSQQTPTLIFDEVDVGIGGQTASIVGQLLKQLSTHAQILCITHLPQVAAYGEHHYHAKKQLHQASVNTQIQKLSEEQRIDEIARMLSGNNNSQHSRSHAKELVELTQQI